MVIFETLLSSAKDDLDAALTALYPAFAAYAAPETLRGSPIRDLNDILASLRSAPLRELQVDALEYYAATALTTVGSPQDFKHFLPRILHFSAEAVAQYGFDPEIVASKLLLADWHEWPVAERTAVANLFYSAWAFARLQHTDMQIRSWNWIRAMATVDLQFEACLDLWGKLPVGNAMLQLAEGGQEIKGLQRGNGFWAEVPADRRQSILEWMASEPVEAALIAAIDLIAATDRWQIERMLDDMDELRRSDILMASQI
jgi:hypothetical protein